MPIPECGCLVFTGNINRHGYGLIKDDSGKDRTVHRVAYELAKGPIPDGLVIDHKCRVRSCVNPDHLEPVTQRENCLRGIGIPAINASKTHCYRGHELSDENTYPGWRDKGERRCKTCTQDRARERHAKRAEEKSR